MKKFLVTSSLLLSSFTSAILAEESKSFYLSIGGGINSINELTGDLMGQVLFLSVLIILFNILWQLVKNSMIGD